jgi:hypothetical protein
VSSWADFDRYVEEHGITEDDYPAAFAQWIAEKTGGPVPRFEKVEREEPAGGVVVEGTTCSRRAEQVGARAGERLSCAGPG